MVICAKITVLQLYASIIPHLTIKVKNNLNLHKIMIKTIIINIMAEYETDGSSALAPNDPYRGMSRRDTGPNLRVIEGGKEKNTANSSAAGRLASAEKSALLANPISVLKGGANEAKSAEQNRPYSPRFVGRGIPGETDGSTKRKGFLKRRGPLLAIMTLLIGGGGIMVGSQMGMPFATANRLIEEFNSMKTTMSKRSDRLLRYQMDTSRGKYRSPTRTTIFGKEKFKLSSKQVARLKTQGIDVMEVDVGGRDIRLLVYDDGSGTKQPILTSTDFDVDQEALNTSLRNASPDVEFKTTKMNLDSAFSIDDFRNGYLKSSKTWKGNFSGWFDSLVLKIFDRVGISRNRFKKWKTASDIEAGNAGFRQAAENQKNPTDEDSNVTKKDDVDTGEVNENGDPIIREGDVEVTGPSDSILGKNKTLTEISNALNSKARKVAQAASTIACAAFAAAGSIHAIVAAQQAAEMINLVTGYLEAVQKVQAGDGDGSPMVYYTNALTSAGENGKSAMSSQGIGALFGSDYMNSNNASVKAANSESLLSDITLMGQNLQFSISKFKDCAYAKAIAGGADLVIDIIGIATGGIGTLIKGLVKSVAWNVLVELGIELIIGTLVKGAATMLMTNYIKDFAGEDLGNAIVSGANKYLGKNHQGGGGSPGSQEVVMAFKRESEAILAKEAEYDRQTRSPFDISSQNTFLGSIFYKIIPVSANVVSTTSILSGISGLLSSSLTSLLPSAGAIADTRLIDMQGNCPMLESIGIMGDAYCNPYYTSDLTTIDNDPGVNFEDTADNNMLSVTRGSNLNKNGATSCRDANGIYHYSMPTNFKVIEEDNEPAPYGNCIMDVELNEDENPVISLNSKLGQYIVFCGQRDSSWGTADANIAAKMRTVNVDTGLPMLDGALSSALGSVPVIGGLMDAMEGAEDSSNAPWIGGEACVASSTNSYWGENKTYQRYMEDQRWLESSGMVEKSSVTVALEEYYEANPLDNSYEGWLARMTGMTKEDVIATLDIIEKVNFLAKYDPTNLLPMIGEPEGRVSLTDEVRGIIVGNYYMPHVPHHVVYVDTRNRSFAV